MIWTIRIWMNMTKYHIIPHHAIWYGIVIFIRILIDLIPRKAKVTWRKVRWPLKREDQFRFWPLTMFLTLPSVYSLGVIHFITIRWPYCIYADQSSRIIFWLLEVFSRETNTSLWDSSFALWQKLGWDNLRWTVFESREKTSSSQNAISYHCYVYLKWGASSWWRSSL